jgi:iron(III) transport system substrate-binding protein
MSWQRSIFGAVAALAGLAALALTLLAAGGERADAGQVLNIYSSRHYDADEQLYADFTARTGIRVNRIEDEAGALIARIRAEGRNSPADILMTVDVGRLWQAEALGLFQPVASPVLAERIPRHLRHDDGLWFGLSKRARVIFYDTARVPEGAIRDYEDLADPRWRGMVCTRSSGNVYMLSLMASMIAHHGRDDAREWAAGVWANRARDPEGGDTDQLRAIVSGQCAIALANTYYFARALRTDVPGLAHPADTSRIGVIFPNQNGRGAHVNISGAGVLVNAPNRDNAVRFLEYLASDEAQRHFSAANDEYPVVPDVTPGDSILALGPFREDRLPLVSLGQNQAHAQFVYDEVGYR